MPPVSLVREGRVQRGGGLGADPAVDGEAVRLLERDHGCFGLLTEGPVRGAGNGEGGIRTLEAGFSPPNALAGRRLQPLGHFSGLFAG